MTKPPDTSSLAHPAHKDTSDASLEPVQTTHITVFTGRFGGGKTETSLNFASYLAKQGRLTGQTAAPLLIDLDLVTPYFRTRDKAEEMARIGVQVITPFPIGRYIHVPAVSPQILGAVEQPSQPVVIDLGGDRQGARALAPYAPSIERRARSLAPSLVQAVGGVPRSGAYTMCFVLNPYRPDPDTGQPLNAIDRIRAAILEIETSARLRVTALVSNPNMLSESTLDLFVAGHHIVQRAGQSLGLPIAFAVVSESLFNQPCFNRQLTEQLPCRLLSPPDGVYPRKPMKRDRSAEKGPLAGAPRIRADIEQMERQALPMLVLHRFFH